MAESRKRPSHAAAGVKTDAVRPSSRAGRAARKGRDRPVSPVELVAVPDTPAEGEPPAAIASAPSGDTSIGRIDPRPGKPGDATGRDRGDDRPSGRAVEAVRMSPKSVDPSMARGEVAPHRPAWQRLALHPPTCRPAFRPAMRRFDGTAVAPLGGSDDFDGVYGTDDRRILYPAGYPWGCIGAIQTHFNPNPGRRGLWSYGWGSGCLVGRSVLLTAGHVIPWHSRDEWSLDFAPGFYDGKSLSGLHATAVAARGWDIGDALVAGDDYAVVRLDQPLGDALGYFGCKVYNDDWEGEPYWTNVGYPNYWPGSGYEHFNGRSPAVQYDIAVDDDDSGPNTDMGHSTEIETQCDASHGQSGGPLFSWWRERDGGTMPYLIGALSGREYRHGHFLAIGNEDDHVHAGGEALLSLVRWARAEWD